ncbi:MAG: hypothetical protein LIP77_00510 [Planctomycetes bacterium]|nr:hypothetical protein [Planctomycetota bacterium]
MPKVGKLRDQGTLAERRHDAFLLALLVALLLNISFFTIQALIPKLSYLLQLLGPDQALAQRQEEDDFFPFVLVDPGLPDEEPDPEQQTEAEANRTRLARQAEAHPELEEGFSFQEEGIDVVLTAPDGNPGPGEGTHDAVASEGSPDGEPMPEVEGTAEADPMDRAEEVEADPLPLPDPSEAGEVPETSDEAASAMPDDGPPDTEPPETSAADSEPAVAVPVEDSPPEPPAEDLAATEAPPAGSDLDPEAEMGLDGAVPEEPLPDLLELAALPIVADGLLSPETRPERSEQWEAANVPPPSRLVPEEFTADSPPPETASAGPRSRDRTNRRQATIRQVGQQARESAPSQAGGSPPRRNTTSSVKVLDADASMALLTHRYGAYMEKLARQLQASLLTQVILTPQDYGRGQVKIRFGISPDGTLTYYETLFPADDSQIAERLLSERMLREAAPFDPLTPQMAQDENFQRMTVVVHIH